MPLGTRSWRRPRGGNRAGGSAWVFQKRSCSSRPWRGHASVLWLSFAAAAACRWWERCHAGACFGLCGRASICSHPWKDLACLYPKATLSPSDFYPVPEFPEKRTDAISAPQKRAAPPREEQACGERCAWCLLKDWYALSCLQGFFFFSLSLYTSDNELGSWLRCTPRLHGPCYFCIQCPFPGYKRGLAGL